MKSLWRNKAQSDRAGVAEFKTLVTLVHSYNQSESAGLRPTMQKQDQIRAHNPFWHLDPVRCPFCVQGNQFRSMIDITGGSAGTFYCTSCRHLIRKDEPTFQCLCTNCRKLRLAP